MNAVDVDQAGTLGNPFEREKRERMLLQAHIAPLTHYVNYLRKELKKEDGIPYFDPYDGGTHARVLYVQQSPGRVSAKTTRFISRNNPDRKAKETFRLHHEAGLKRSDTVLWNIIPWYRQPGENICKRDRLEGMKYLNDLMDLLSNLKALVLAGRQAQQAFEESNQELPFQVIYCNIPSPYNIEINFKDDAHFFDDIRSVLKELVNSLRRD